MPAGDPLEPAAASRRWPAILVASGLPLAGEGGRGRAVVAAPLLLGTAGEREIVDLFLAERRPVAAVRSAIAAALPADWALADLHDVWVGAPSAPSALVAAEYRVVVTGAPRWAVMGAALALLAAPALPRERRREKRTTSYDLRPLILDLAVRAADAGGVTVGMRLRHVQDAVGRPDEVVAALGEPPAAPLATPLVVRSIVRERLVLADNTDAPPPAWP
jgi:radical SAM-linked protein